MSDRRPDVSITVSPATADRFDDLAAVFGRRGADPGWCWCQLFVRPRELEPPDPADRRGALRSEVERATVAPGLIAYADGEPAGWTRVGPRASLPGVTGNRALARVLGGDPASTWWVACFAVRPRHRRMGVASALLEAAVCFALDHGATAVEGHPVDVAGLRAGRAAASSLYTGTRSLFAAAGFVEVGATRPTRPVMRLEL
ncbi:MAG TPA: GNAT family N-acetyltransferase [Acidimicrobiales bacterium]|nr:GNAT family N-acetyltransferase [Acidimicrobiales bacterium]